MRHAKSILLACALCFATVARSDDVKPVDAKQELQAAIDILKTHHMNRDQLDWSKATADAYALLGNATRPEDAYPAIRQVITALGVRHTNLFPADFVKAEMSGSTVGGFAPPYWAPPEGHLLLNNIGFLSVHSYQAGPPHEAEYANGGRAALLKLVAGHACRFIVDLRANQGNDMFAMLNAVDALLGSETPGYWQMTGSATDEAWVGMTGRFANANASRNTGSLRNAPVAVLLGALTASAGEFTAIAFKGRPRTRFFGETTAGFVSTNAPYYLPDGAFIAVSGGWSTDRLHRQYRTALVPDEPAPRGQATLDAAIAWLKKQPCPKR
jgi:hypothetical protein